MVDSWTAVFVKITFLAVITLIVLVKTAASELSSAQIVLIHELTSLRIGLFANYPVFMLFGLLVPNVHGEAIPSYFALFVLLFIKYCLLATAVSICH